MCSSALVYRGPTDPLFADGQDNRDGHARSSYHSLLVLYSMDTVHGMHFYIRLRVQTDGSRSHLLTTITRYRASSLLECGLSEYR